jgi:uncharacterized repeat protein (TIGR01451 family)
MGQATLRRLTVGIALAALAATAILLGAVNLPGKAAAGAPDPANLSVAKSDSPDPVQSGAVLTYTLRVHNAGPDPATNTVLTDNLPASVDFISATPSTANCSFAARKVVCNLPGSVSTTTDRVITIKVRVHSKKKSGQISNSASVTSAETDPNLKNNSDTEVTKIAKPPKPPKKPTCAGVPATIVGTPGPDTLFGTAGDDVIRSFGGDDSVFGFRGGDLVCAGGGSDFVLGGKGNDFIRGGSGSDRIRGRSGDDSLFGRRGRDRLRGGSGDDLLAGGHGFDRCRGGGGVDRKRSCERR